MSAKIKLKVQVEKNKKKTAKHTGKKSWNRQGAERRAKRQGGINILLNQDERKREQIMYLGVAFFMVLIMGAWLLNIKHSFQKISLKSANSDFDLDKLKNNFNFKKFKEAEKETKPVKSNDFSKNLQKATSTDASSSLANFPQSDNLKTSSTQSVLLDASSTAEFRQTKNK